MLSLPSFYWSFSFCKHLPTLCLWCFSWHPCPSHTPSTNRSKVFMFGCCCFCLDFCWVYCCWFLALVRFLLWFVESADPTTILEFWLATIPLDQVQKLAVTHTTCELLWLKHLNQELQLCDIDPMEIILSLVCLWIQQKFKRLTYSRSSHYFGAYSFMFYFTSWWCSFLPSLIGLLHLCSSMSIVTSWLHMIYTPFSLRGMFGYSIFVLIQLGLVC